MKADLEACKKLAIQIVDVLFDSGMGEEWQLGSAYQASRSKAADLIYQREREVLRATHERYIERLAELGKEE